MAGIATTLTEVPLAAVSSATVSSAASIAWLLRRSPVMLPIPGTGKVAHLEENVAAVDIELSDTDEEAIANSRH